MEDKDLIEAAQVNLDNFKLLYKKYVKSVYRYCYYRLGRNKDLAEDIASETFVKAIEKFPSFEYRKKPFIAWLYTIAHNLIVDHYRSKKEGNISLDSMIIPPSEEADEIIDKLSKEELKEKIEGKLRELSDELANIFTLRHTEDLTFAEIAKLTGKTEGAVKMQYYRGLKLLQSLILKSDN